MARLQQIQSVLQETGAAIAQLERALAKDPDSPSLRLVGRSLTNQFEQFRAEFLAEADRIEVDVCTYRLFSVDDRRYSVDGITTALQGFQRLFTIVYDALKGRPKERAIISAEVMRETEFGWAYTFPGSVGMVLTLPQNRDLFGRNHYLNQTIDAVFAMVQSKTADEVLDFSHRVGPSAIRQMYRWADDHAKWGMGADIHWRGLQSSDMRLFIQVPAINNLRNVISLSSETKEEEIEIVGELIGADVDRRSFHIKPIDTQKDIRGYFGNAITADHKAQLPGIYLAKLRRTARIVYSTEQEDEQHYLLSLTPWHE